MKLQYITLVLVRLHCIDIYFRYLSAYFCPLLYIQEYYKD